jgi:hypothetical protein
MKKPRKYGFDPKLNVEERKAFGKHYGDELWVEYISKIKKKSDKKGISKSKRKLKK